MGAGFWLSDLVLCGVQGLLVLVPGRTRPSGSRLIGVLVPAGLLALGVLIVRAANGARLLTDLASFGTVVAAGGAGYLLAWRKPWSAALGAAALFLVAWRMSGVIGDAAGVVLIALACLSGAALAELERFRAANAD